jgi:hypothetical protein
MAAGITIKQQVRGSSNKQDQSILVSSRITNSQLEDSLRQTRRRFTRAAFEITSSKELESYKR